MLALQTTPLHLRDQEKQERRFDQSLFFNHSRQHLLYIPPIQNHTSQDDLMDTPIQKIEARIAQMTMEDCEKEKIVLLLT
ncbi:hypothetical protein BGZ65_000031, partial [Modicella reniformis]